MNQFTVEEQNKFGEMISKQKNIVNLIEEFSIKLRHDNVLKYGLLQIIQTEKIYEFVAFFKLFLYILYNIIL